MTTSKTAVTIGKARKLSAHLEMIRIAAEGAIPDIRKDLGIPDSIGINLIVKPNGKDNEGSLGETSPVYSDEAKGITDFKAFDVTLFGDIRNKTVAISGAAHELRHVWQMATGKQMDFGGMMLWDDKLYITALLPYMMRPNEKDARVYQRDYMKRHGFPEIEESSEAPPFDEMMMLMEMGHGPNWETVFPQRSYEFARDLFKAAKIPSIDEIITLLKAAPQTGSSTFEHYLDDLNDYQIAHKKYTRDLFRKIMA